MPPAVAIVGAGLIGAGASYLAGERAAEAQESAAATQYGAQMYGIQQEREMFDMQMSLYREMHALQERLMEPFREAGRAALPGLVAEATNLEFSPLYNLQRDELQLATRRAYASRGKLQSPEAMDAEIKGTQLLAATEADKQYAQLWGLANLGLSASGGAGQGLAGAANAAGNQGSILAQLYANLGAGQAQYVAGAGQSRAGAMGDIGSIAMGAASGYGNYLAWNQMMNANPTLTSPSDASVYNAYSNLESLYM